MKRALAFLCGLLLAALQAHAEPIVDAVSRVVIPVSDLDRAAEFYARALTFEVDEGGGASGVIMRLGGETIELLSAGGRKIPGDSRSNDRWFQHLAIVVSDIDRAYAQVLRAGATPISAGPQTLPAWNPNAGGIRAVYFRDPDGHPLELIQFPAGKERRAGRRRIVSSSASTTARSPPAIQKAALPFIAIVSACTLLERARTGASSRNASPGSRART